MSLNRLALRLSVLSALNNNGQEPWPTLAGEHVYDSRIDDLESIAREGPTPVVVVYTDGDSGTVSSQAFRVSSRVTTLTIDIAMAVRVARDAGDDPELGIPVTDDELELQLDILEAQVMDCLAGESVGADIARTIMTGQSAQISSDRGASKDGGYRLAGRSIVVSAGRLQDWPAGHPTPPYITRLLDLLGDNPMRSPQVPMLQAAFGRGGVVDPMLRTARSLDMAEAHRAALGLPVPDAPTLPGDFSVETDFQP